MDKRDLIRKHAIEVFAKEGYHNTKVSTIADNAGIAVGTIYNYFKNKQEIFDYIFEVMQNERITYLNTLKNKRCSSLAMLNLFINFQFEQWEENPDIFKILMQEGIPFSKVSTNIH